ncbi:unnamed protein product [Protopolystoma xenopodis]|uniref:Peptidylamidoglycolate lyase n=1 Tax=Protopolystoma xenopodis TaxID=117903 RepID=A0A448XBA7_9PLAT|nr:unnamed protein product [Protopolystoma xenopodis]
MKPSFDNVHNIMYESSARFHSKSERKSRGLCQHEYRIKAKRPQYNEIHPSSSGYYIYGGLQFRLRLGLISIPNEIRYRFGSIAALLPLHCTTRHQIGGLAVANGPDTSDQLVVFHRGQNIWQTGSFDATYRYTGDRSLAGRVISPLLLVDSVSGHVAEVFGSGQFVLPHGVFVQHNGPPGQRKPTALWLTDVALHQVFKFTWANWERPTITLGRAFEPGATNEAFCQPADVLGDVYVADGYCNQRIVVFHPNGTFKMSWPSTGVLKREGDTRPFGDWRFGENSADQFYSVAYHSQSEDYSFGAYPSLSRPLPFAIVHSLTLVPPIVVKSGPLNASSISTPATVSESNVGSDDTDKLEETSLEQICAADRENSAIYCYDLEGSPIAHYTGTAVLRPSVYSIAYSVKHE